MPIALSRPGIWMPAIRSNSKARPAANDPEPRGGIILLEHALKGAAGAKLKPNEHRKRTRFQPSGRLLAFLDGCKTPDYVEWNQHDDRSTSGKYAERRALPKTIRLTGELHNPAEQLFGGRERGAESSEEATLAPRGGWNLSEALCPTSLVAR
ncbi:hypothetical protein ACE10Z_35415 [Bradyrhizobium sp. Pha-3]|uniref:hypothetical protein n=1 Tax=Bradyrhizobium sp. Pha-3 TaxID=208375 RepID=UPI0035D50704